MDARQMKTRTRDFALRIIRLTAALPAGKVGDVLGRQILKSGTSIGANYREALRASSRRHFISNLEIAQREAEETLYWLELLTEAELMKPRRLEKLNIEGQELLAIITATIRSSKARASASNQKSEIRNQKS